MAESKGCLKEDRAWAKSAISRFPVDVLQRILLFGIHQSEQPPDNPNGNVALLQFATLSVVIR